MFNVALVLEVLKLEVRDPELARVFLFSNGVVGSSLGPSSLAGRGLSILLSKLGQKYFHLLRPES
jgi:hypothetical protein